MIYNLNDCYYNGLIIPMEIWRPITDEMVPGVRPVYWISNIGNLYNSELGRYSNASIKPNDYIRVILRSVDGKQISTTIHRLVCLAFNGPCPGPNYDVDHINSDRTCSIENNLEFVSKAENAKRAKANNLLTLGEDRSHSIMTNSEVEEICQMLEQGVPINEIAFIMEQKIYPRQYSGGMANIIYQILHGVIWKSISEKYSFNNYSRIHMNESEIENVCKALSEGKKYDYIIDVVLNRSDCSYTERERLKESLYNIKRGRSFKNISSKYF